MAFVHFAEMYKEIKIAQHRDAYGAECIQTRQIAQDGADGSDDEWSDCSSSEDFYDEDSECGITNELPDPTIRRSRPPPLPIDIEICKWGVKIPKAWRPNAFIPMSEEMIDWVHENHKQLVNDSFLGLMEPFPHTDAFPVSIDEIVNQAFSTTSSDLESEAAGPWYDCYCADVSPLCDVCVCTQLSSYRIPNPSGVARTAISDDDPVSPCSNTLIFKCTCTEGSSTCEFCIACQLATWPSTSCLSLVLTKEIIDQEVSSHHCLQSPFRRSIGSRIKKWFSRLRRRN